MQDTQNGGIWELVVKDAKAGTLYKYTIDGKGPFPDPVSRSQPKGVHGPSQVVDASKYQWTDAEYRKTQHEADNLVLYEVHVGTFTPEGTFEALRKKIETGYFKELGVTAIELLPLNDFPGEWNWGYDGVMLYAPARCYGTPDDLRHLVDTAHKHNLSMCLDLVYNHFGPDGNYLGCYSPFYFTEKHKTPWGDAPNIDPSVQDSSEKKAQDGPSPAIQVRKFFLENALHCFTNIILTVSEWMPLMHLSMTVKFTS